MTTGYYDEGSTSTSAAQNLADALNASASPVTATLSGSVITLTAKEVGTSSNYSLSVSSILEVIYENFDGGSSMCILNTLLALDLQPRSPIVLENDNAAQATLQLSIDVSRQYNCVDGPLTYEVLILKFTYRNMGDVAIILDKEASLIAKSVVSRNLKEFRMQRYEENARLHFELPFRHGALDESVFVILKPAESYSLEKEYWKLVGGPRERRDEFLRKGDHVGILSIGTWLYSREGLSEWREKWRDKGYLWAERVESQPMQFTIKDEPTTSKCSP